MYKRVEAEIALSGISRKEIARTLGIGYNTLNLKISGKRVFSLKEAVEIKRLLNSKETIEALFSRS